MSRTTDIWCRRAGLAGLLCLALLHAAAQAPALELARRVAGRMIQDTRFEWKHVPQTMVLGMQVIDFRFLRLQPQQQAYARCSIKAGADTLLRFGVTAAGNAQVWVNGRQAWGQEGGAAGRPKETSYNRFRFSGYFSAQLQKGENEILVKYVYSPALAVVFLRPVTTAGDQDTAAAFDTAGWAYLGPLPASAAIPGTLLPVRNGKDGYEGWQRAPQHLLPGLVTDSGAVYQRDPYSDWHYSHGIAVWSILALDKAIGGHPYLPFAQQYTRFLLDNYDWLQWQYDSLFAWRGSYHRVFRCSMLDDAGAPALPFAALYLQQKDSALKRLLDRLLEYVVARQVRLADGTFCRPEPEEFTVWADDLFMSVPFLVTMARAAGRQQYLDDAAKQAIQFRKYLLDPETGLYRHGWFSRTGKQSIACWGRANGWVAWAMAELLEELPPRHPAYKKVLQAFRLHMKSLLPYQAASGMWRQLLNRPAAYEETSCTAMFALAMARGVRRGWLPAGYRQYALKAWKGVAAKIDANGTVHGICRGTEIGDDEAFYLNRKTVDHDPRGLGAVIMAGIEIAQLQ